MDHPTFGVVVRSRETFLAFLDRLRGGQEAARATPFRGPFDDDRAGWINVSMKDYLDAMAGWMEDAGWFPLDRVREPIWDVVLPELERSGGEGALADHLSAISAWVKLGVEAGPPDIWARAARAMTVASHYE